MTSPQEEGAQACRHNRPLFDNPYARYTPSWEKWNEGWQMQHYDLNHSK
jgi:hypothetical protein